MKSPSKVKNSILLSFPALVVVVVLVELLLRYIPYLNSIATDASSLHTPYTYNRDVTLFEPNMSTRVDYLTGTSEFTFETNAFGLRSRPIRHQKPDSTLRVLCVGDSFTEGFGVNQNETYPNQLDQILRGVGVDAEVLCAAMAGLHIWHYVDLVHHYGDLLRPDVVVLGIYSGNDIEASMLDAPGRRHQEARYGFLVPKSQAKWFRSNLEVGTVYFTEGWSWLSDLDWRLWGVSRAYRLLSNGLFQTSSPVNLLSGMGVLRVGPKIEPTRLPVLNMDTDLYLAETDSENDLNLLFDSAEMAFGDMVNYTSENDISLLVLNIPEGWQNPAWSFQTPKFMRLHDKSRVHDFWMKMNRKYDVPFRDLRPLYKTAWNQGAHTIFDLSAPHGHFSKTDNSLVAFVLLEALIANGYVKVVESELAEFLEQQFPDVFFPFGWTPN